MLWLLALGHLLAPLSHPAEGVLDTPSLLVLFRGGEEDSETHFSAHSRAGPGTNPRLLRYWRPALPLAEDQEPPVRDRVPYLLPLGEFRL